MCPHAPRHLLHCVHELWARAASWSLPSLSAPDAPSSPLPAPTWPGGLTSTQVIRSACDFCHASCRNCSVCSPGCTFLSGATSPPVGQGSAYAEHSSASSRSSKERCCARPPSLPRSCMSPSSCSTLRPTAMRSASGRPATPAHSLASSSASPLTCMLAYQWQAMRLPGTVSPPLLHANTWSTWKPVTEFRAAPLSDTTLP
mmetsp:Transcript_18615/g.47171  ORF Transcript_18615/g.47171 Transcript_18615/m.47171 type:complete len:201 (+) Transcript_18615:140-742(+)